MCCCAAVQLNTCVFPAATCIFMKTKFTLQNSFAAKNRSYIGSFMLKWKPVGFWCAEDCFGEAWQWPRGDVMYNKTMDARCSALQHWDIHHAGCLISFLLLWQTCAHAPFMQQRVLSPLIKHNLLLPWGEDLENARTQVKITGSQSYLWLQILLALHKWTILFPVACYDWALTTAGWNTWQRVLQKSQLPVQRLQQHGWYLLGHPWTIFSLLSKPPMVANFYCSLSTWMATNDWYLFLFP